MSDRYDIVIPARGGSRGIPRKNILPLADKPLVAWSIESALQVPFNRRVFVSTDDEEIAAIAVKYGAEVPYMRPAALATAEAHSAVAVLHHLDWLEQQEQPLPRGIFMLLPTSPFRTGSDLANMVQVFEADPACSSVLACVEDTGVPRAIRRLKKDYLASFDGGDPTGQPNLQRQQVEVCYRINGCGYLTKPETLRRFQSFVNVPSAVPYVMNAFSAVDIDNCEDWIIAEHLVPVLRAAILDNRPFAGRNHAEETN